MTATAPSPNLPTTRTLVIDADGHVLEPPDLWENYLAADERDLAQRLVVGEDGREWWEIAGQRHRVASPAGALAGEDWRELIMNPYRWKYSEVHQRGSDPAYRLKVMASEGIDAAVLYPTLALWHFDDLRLLKAHHRAYNNWLADFCKTDPRRLFGIAAVPLADVPAAVAELRRCVEELGFVGAFIRPNPYHEGKRFNDPIYDPFWQAAEELNCPIGLHPFLMEDMPGACRAFGLDQPGEIFFKQAISNPVDMMVSLSFLVGGGVLERFPRLKVIFLETGGGWIAHWLERLDHHYKVLPFQAPWLKRKPSEYFKRQCFISFDPDEATLVPTARLIGADRVIWASDYPHPDATFPGVVAELRENLTGLTETEQRQILGENARALYGLR